jgi:putative membrane protein
MTRRFFRLAVLSLGMLVLASGAKAQVLAPFDQLFLRSEARSNAYEVALAQLASTRAAAPEVKAYADTVLQDHAAHDGALRDLAVKKGMNLDMALSQQSKAAIERLSHLKGRAFDRAFIAEARRVNNAAIRAFRTEASRTADPDLRRFVADGLALDEQHDAALAALAPKPRGMPVIRPPVGGNMPILPPPSGGTTPVIPPR